MRNVAIARAVDNLTSLNASEAVFVRDDHRCDAAFLHLHVAGHAVIEHRQMVAVLQDEFIAQQFELFDIWNPHTAPVFGDEVGPQVVEVLRAIFCHAELLQQLQRNAFHDEAPRWFVDQAIEIRQPHRGDDAAGKTRAFDEQSLRAIASR